MKISVVIPTYKRPRCVEAILDDLARQTRRADEVIIVDDTPGDEIQKVCAAAAIPVVCLHNDGPNGITQARNVGLEHLTGDVVTFLDSDVRLEPRYLAAIEDVLEKHPDAPGAMGHIRDYPRNPVRNTVLRLLLLSHAKTDVCRLRFPPRITYPQPLTKVVRSNFLHGCNMTYRVADIGGLRFDGSMRRYAYMEDLDFSTRVREATGRDFVVTPKAGVRHIRETEGRINEVDLFRMRLVNKYYLANGHRLRWWQHVALKAQDLGNLAWFGFYAPLKSIRYFAAMLHVWWMVARHRADLKARQLDKFNAHYAFMSR